MGSKAMTGGVMPSPNAYFSPPSVEELLDKLMKAIGMTMKELDEHDVGVTNVQRIGQDVVITAYAGGKFVTFADKLRHFPSDALVDKLRVLF